MSGRGPAFVSVVNHDEKSYYPLRNIAELLLKMFESWHTTLLDLADSPQPR